MKRIGLYSGRIYETNDGLEECCRLVSDKNLETLLHLDYLSEDCKHCFGCPESQKAKET